MLLPLALPVYAQTTDTIRLANKDLVTANLKPGVYQYIVYYTHPKKNLIAGLSLWRREVKFKTDHGKDLIEIKQNWNTNDTLFNRYVYSLANRKTFAPIYHYTRDKNGIDAFNFTTAAITGADSIANNNRKDFRVAQAVPTLNWELDLEVFNTLPFKKVGQQFAINFYHPGGKTEPKYYVYKVIGTDMLNMPEGRKVDCWKLKIEYAENSWAVFWIDRKSKEVLKMEEFFRGMYRYKVRVI